MLRRLGPVAVGAMCLATLGLPATGHAGGTSSAAISLVQTVMVDTGSDVCGVATSITVPSGTTVRYCYTATNTGSVNLSLHTVFGSFDGSVLTNFSFTLVPAASAFITSTEVVTSTVTNLGTWLATNANNDMAQGQASTTVTVANTQHTASGEVTAVFTPLSACALTITVSVADNGDDAGRYTLGAASRPAAVGAPTPNGYFGFPEGDYKFEVFSTGVGGSLNGTYTFTVSKMAGDGTEGITNPVIVTVEVDDLPDCGPPGSLTIVKSTSEEISTPEFQFTGDFTFSLAAGDKTTFDELQARAYEITETALDGWTLTSAGCDTEFEFDDETRTLAVIVGPGESVICEFVNEPEDVPPTTDDSGSGTPTTTQPRGLPRTGPNSASSTLAGLAIGMVFAGTALLFTRRRLPR